MSSQSATKRISLTTLTRMKSTGEKFACLTAYDSCFAEMISSAGIEVILVGDSPGMVLQGHESTLPVTLEDIVYHMHCVQANSGSLIMADLRS